MLLQLLIVFVVQLRQCF